MNTSKPHSFAKKVLLGALVLLQAAYPSAASANQYMQLMSVRDLVVTSGGALPYVNVDSANTSTTTTLAGNAVLKATPSAVNFGPVVTGTQSQVQTVTLSNLGGAPAVLGTLATNAQFSVTDNCDGVTLPSLGTCQVNVAFAPTQVALGGLWGTLSVPLTAGTSSATALLGLQGVATLPSGTALQSATLSGFSGTDPALAINANGLPQISFASAQFNQQSSSKTFTLNSTGNAPVVFSGLTLTGTNSTDGSYSASSDCPAQLPNGASCTVAVTFAPGSIGTKSATLSVNTSSMNGNVMPVVLTGSATSDSTFSLSASQLNFGGLTVGQVTTQSIEILNTGNIALTSPSIVASGSFLGSTHNCPATLAVGDSCTASVSFEPTSVAHVAGTLSVSFAGSATATAVLGGTGLGPVLSVDALSQNFGAVVVGESASRTYTLSNDGNVAAPLSFGAMPANVTRTDDCPTAIAAGAVCHLVFTYNPTNVTPLSGTTTVASTLNTLTLGFVGTATYLPSFSLSSSSIAFGGVATGTTAQMTVSVNNTGNVPLSTPAISSTGTGYASTNNCADTLAVGTSCTVTVTFAPTTPQSYSGSLSAAFNGLTAQTATLSGTGQQAVLAVDAATQSFGSIDIGATGTLTYNLSNSGNLAAQLSYEALPASVTRRGSCSTVLGAGASCTVALTYAPADTTTTSGAMTVSATSTSATLRFSGTGVALPSFDLSATTVAFGNVASGASSQLSVTVNNSGNVALSTPAITATGPGYSAAHNCAASLAVGASCTVTLTFAPTAAQDYAGSLSVAFSGLTAQTASLTGTGQGTVLGLDATTKDFGNVNIGSTGTLSYLLTNSGNIAASLSYGAPTTGVVRTGTCSSTLGAGVSCTIVLSYTPTDTATMTGALSISAPSSSTTLSFSGTGVANPSFGLSASSLAFGNLATSSFAQMTVSVNNSGNVPLTTPVITTSAGYTAAHDCAATLAVGTSCLVTVTFAPSAPQSYPSILSVGYSGVEAQTAILSGTGQSAVLVVNSSTQVFGSVNIGETSNKTYTLTNTGNITAVLSYSTMTAPVTKSGTCTATLGAGASCTVVLTYAPTDTSSVSDSLIVSALHTAVTLSYSGTGVALPGFSLSAANVVFGNLAANATSQQSVTVNNTGNVPLSTPVISTTGAGYSAVHNCAAMLSVATSCTVTLTFAPTVAQSYSGSLSVGFSGLTAQTAALSGTGQSAVLVVAPTTQAFGSVSIGLTSNKAYTLTNNGNIVATLAIGAVAAPMTRGGTCATTLGAGASCTVVLTYAPLDTSTTSNSFIVSATNTSVTLSYSGTGVALSLSLASATLPVGLLDVSYNAGAGFDFKSLLSAPAEPGFNPSLATFTLASGTLPAGLSLSATGVLTGTPTQLTANDGVALTVSTTYKGNQTQQNFKVPVRGFASCDAVLAAKPGSVSGNYYLDLDGAGPGASVQYYCDMTPEGQGWMRLDATNATFSAAVSAQGVVSKAFIPENNGCFGGNTQFSVSNFVAPVTTLRMDLTRSSVAQCSGLSNPSAGTALTGTFTKYWNGSAYQPLASSCTWNDPNWALSNSIVGLPTQFQFFGDVPASKTVSYTGACNYSNDTGIFSATVYVR